MRNLSVTFVETRGGRIWRLAITADILADILAVILVVGTLEGIMAEAAAGILGAIPAETTITAILSLWVDVDASIQSTTKENMVMGLKALKPVP